MKKLKALIYQCLVSSDAGVWVVNHWFKRKFVSSAGYWENRYRTNGTSGQGSQGSNAVYKAGILNKFVLENKIKSVIEFGCGDGVQLSYFNFKTYIGLDISTVAIAKCTSQYKDDNSKTFMLYSGKEGFEETLLRSELALSLDVIYHLVEDDVYGTYMSKLFLHASRFVIIYAWDLSESKKFHVKHRKFTDWIAFNQPGWQLIKVIAAPSMSGLSDFYIYEKEILPE